MNIINGTLIANVIYKDLEQRISELPSLPELKIILATDDQSSHTYAKLKQSRCVQIGINCEIKEFSETASPEQLIREINNTCKLNVPVMVQLPLYASLEPCRAQILNSILPDLDADGLTSSSLGNVLTNSDPIYPATVKAVLRSLDYVSLECGNPVEEWLKGKQAIIINNSNLIGKPLSMALSNLGATVTVANKHTSNLKQLANQAQILITATGNPGLVTPDYIRTGATIIDITSKRTLEGVKGDVVLDSELEAKVDWITPVPGGIGPLTVACLLENVVEIYERIQTESNLQR